MICLVPLLYIQLQAFILDVVIDVDGIDLPDRQAKINRLFERFNSEYGWRADQVGKHTAMTDWLQGLAIDIPYKNVDIVEIAIAFGSIDDNPSDKLFERVCNNYWAFMANIILGMEKEYKH